MTEWFDWAKGDQLAGFGQHSSPLIPECFEMEVPRPIYTLAYSLDILLQDPEVVMVGDLEYGSPNQSWTMNSGGLMKRKNCEHLIRKSWLLLIMTLLSASLGYCTPSTMVWIPSTDIQSYGAFHVGIDNYFTVFKKGTSNGGTAFPTDLGLTVGVLPVTQIQMEVGVDLLEPQDSPWLFNAKIGVPEGTLWDGSPAFAFGGMNFGLKKNVTDANILYALAAKTFPVVGRITAGYFSGNANLLVTELGEKQNKGLLLSWDRQMAEISDKLYALVDYQGGKSSMGAVSLGVAWSFSPDVSVIVGYDIFHNHAPSTLTTQLDINL
jgi:hypothetical protein